MQYAKIILTITLKLYFRHYLGLSLVSDILISQKKHVGVIST